MIPLEESCDDKQSVHVALYSVIAAVEMALADLGYPVKIGEGTRTATELLRELPAAKA